MLKVGFENLKFTLKYYINCEVKTYEKTFIMMLSTAVILGGIGCGAKKDSNTEIIGGADAPTSIYLPSTTDEEKTDYADPMDESTYYQVMPRKSLNLSGRRISCIFTILFQKMVKSV